MKNSFLVLCMALHSFLAVRAQESLKYPFVHYGENEGLAATNVQQVFQDSTGYIWIATVSGLQRYDGIRYLSFRANASAPGSIPDNDVRGFVTDAGGRMWISLNNGQAGIFDTHRFRYQDIPVRSDQQIILAAPKNLVADSRGNVFFLCGDRLFVCRKGKNAFVEDSSWVKVPVGPHLFDIKEDPLTGKYWISTQYGLAVYNTRTGLLSDGVNNRENDPVIGQLKDHQNALRLHIDKRHRLWMTNWPNGAGSAFINVVNLGTNERVLNDYSLIPIYRIYIELLDLMDQADSSVWIYGSPVMARFNEEQKVFEPVHNGYLNEYSISFDGVNHMLEDRESNIWVSTDNNGLYRFNPSQQYFQNVRVTNRQTGQPGTGSVLSFADDDDGSLLAGTWGEGIFRYSATLKKIPLNIKGIPEDNTIFVWNMQRSGNRKTIWFGAQPGLWAYDVEARSAKFYDPPALRHITVRQVAEDSTGNLWLGMHRGGLFKWSIKASGGYDNKNIKHIRGVPETMITSVITASNGMIWVGTEASGAYVIDPNTDSVILRLRMNGPEGERLIDDRVASILQYDSSRVIVASRGLNIYDIRNGHIERIVAPGTLSPYMASMEKGDDGFLWVSFSSGLSRVNLDKKIFIHFYKVDGIINDHFRVGSSTCLRDGRLAFGSTNQFVVLQPSKVRFSNESPPVVITDIKVMNQPLLVDSLLNIDRLELEPGQNAITINFSGLNYNGAYLITYRLDNLDAGWQVANSDNQAVYSYLPPGTYTFRLQSQDEEGNPGPEMKPLVIRIRPPFWRTWWFGSLVVFALLGLLFWLDRQRTQKIRATESIRTRIATSLTEDLSNSLSSINISSELAKTKIDHDTARTKEYIGQISDTSNRMVQSMYDMVWSISPENDSMHQCIERMKSFAVEVENLQDVDIVFDIDQSVTDPEIDMEHRYEMLSIFKEAVTNAARHSGGKHIFVSIRYRKPKFSLLIQDDGRGFDLESAELGRGIADMRRRATAIHAELKIKTEINTGTSVKLVMNV